MAATETSSGEIESSCSNYKVAAPPTRDQILERLRNRLKPHQQLVTVISHYQTLLNEHVALRSRHDRIRSHNEQTGDDSSSSEEVTRLKVELSDVYRLKALNDQKLLDANASLLVKDKQIADLRIELDKTRQQFKSIQTMKESLENRLLEQQKLTQHVRDEHLALSATFAALEEKYRRVQEENSALVDRWMQLKATQADQVNAENEKVAKQAQQKLRTDLEEAATSVVKFVGNVIPYIEGDNLEYASEAGSGSAPPRKTSGPQFVVADVAPTDVRHKFSAHSGQADALCWSYSGNFLATGATDRKIKLWKLDHGKHEKAATLQGCNQSVTCIDIDAEDKFLLAGSNDFAVRLWTVADQRCRDSLTGHSGKVYAARFYSQGSKAVSGGHDRTIKIWDLRSRRCERTLFAFSTVHDLVADDGMGASIISGHFDKKLRLWDARASESEPNKEILLEGRVTSLSLTSDRQKLLCSARDDALHMIDLRTYNILRTFRCDDFHLSSDTARAALSPEATLCAAGSADGTLFVWRVSDGTLLQTLTRGGHDSAITSVAWHPMGHRVASADRHGTVCVWEEGA